MAQLISAPRGTQDLLPDESYKRKYAERLMTEVCSLYGYKEIRLPTFEHTELFARGVGDTTDVVGKEMYTFLDRGGRSITLRPEGTAGVVRAALEHGLLKGALPLRAYYLMPCFRYEKPQAGRLREYNTLGIELFGSTLPDADIEVISLGKRIYEACGVDAKLELNSIGCPACRAEYRKALVSYFEQKSGELCGTCRDRLDKNPMRILDCKSPVCGEISRGAPVVLDYLCDDCREHFELVKSGLTAVGIEFSINPKIVRGLDYYTRTVFEFVHEGAGYSGTLSGGGRYDGLVALLGGDSVPAVGFGMGIERLVAIMETEPERFPPDDAPELFIGYIGDEAARLALRLTDELRGIGVSAQYDITGRSLKAQLKYADKLMAKHSLVIGDEELSRREGELKNMTTKETVRIGLAAEKIADALKRG